MPSNASSFFYRVTIVLMSAIAASVLIGNVVQTNNNNILTVSHMAIAQTQPYSSAHSHILGLFSYPQDPFHSLFPIRNIEMSKFLVKA